LKTINGKKRRSVLDISATIAQDLCDSIGRELDSIVSIAGMSGAVVASTVRERIGDAE
jgi:methyl-accepting chemotaxis protein